MLKTGWFILHLLLRTNLDMKDSVNCLWGLQLKLRHLHWSLVRHVCLGLHLLCKFKHLHNSLFSGAKLKQVGYWVMQNNTGELRHFAIMAIPRTGNTVIMLHSL